MAPTEHDDDSVIGEECHIISPKPTGPRHDPSFLAADLHAYSNLILLCRVHHKIVDDQPETFTAEILLQLKDKHDRWVSESLDNATRQAEVLPTTLSEAFQRVKSSMPRLVAEMKADLEKPEDEFTRNFFIASKRWVLNTTDPCFVYYLEDHPNLQGKVHVLENYGFVIDVTPGNTKMYRMTEEFVELLVTS